MTRILVVEDQQDLRNDITEMLRLEGFEVYDAENGLVGIQLAREVVPEIIVCDIMMPEVDGYGVLEQVRKDNRLSFIPFIFLTAKTDRVNMRHGMVLGADDYLTKPFIVDELLASIHAQLNRRQQLNVHLDARLERLRESIITALPHELRTPLNIILGFSEMLRAEAKTVQTDQIIDWSDHINIAAQQLYRLVENYIYYAQLQVASHTPQSRAEFNEASLTDSQFFIEMQAEKTMRKYGRFNDLVLKLTQAPPIRINQTALLKILDELLDNANKFSPGDSPITVKTQTLTDKNYYEICIRDAGRGISQEQIDNIGAYMQFERGYYEQQGIGMGLVLVQYLVHLYGGELIITTPKIGTQVCVHLPIVL